MTFRELCEHISFSSRVTAKDRYSGKILFQGYAPTLNTLDGLVCARYNVYLIRTEIDDDGSLFVVSLIKTVR